jgi:dienelactone hydrolase
VFSVKSAAARFPRCLAAVGFAVLLPGAAEAANTYQPGATTEYSVKLPAYLLDLAAGGPGKKPPATLALCAVAVPENFDPARPWPVLVVSATTGNRGAVSSRRLMARFTAPALATGWVVVAADPDQPVAPEQDTNSLRYALCKAAIAVLALDWPGSEKWPVAFGGFSGGAKRSAWLAALSSLDRRQPIGVFQGGCNEPAMEDALENYRPERRSFLAIPVFLSSGDEDSIATPEQQEAVRAELTDSGFRRVRLETYPGGHEPNAAHITAALKWFSESVPAPGKKP